MYKIKYGIYSYQLQEYRMHDYQRDEGRISARGTFDNSNYELKISTSNMYVYVFIM